MSETTINIGTINVGAPEQAGNVLGELARGVSPEALRDTGDDVPEGVEDIAVPAPPVTPEEDDGRLEALEARSDQDAINAISRRTYLIQLIKEIGSHRKIEGFTVNHHKDRQPRNRAGIERKNHNKQVDGQETLDRACGVCALAETCKIRGDLGAWISSHAFAGRDDMRMYTATLTPGVVRSEGRMKFLRRLNIDPLAHCIPPKPESQRKVA